MGRSHFMIKDLKPNSTGSTSHYPSFQQKKSIDGENIPPIVMEYPFCEVPIRPHIVWDRSPM